MTCLYPILVLLNGKVGAVGGRCLSITATGSPHVTLHLQTRTDSITRDDFVKVHHTHYHLHPTVSQSVSVSQH
jgi:hypothetical protein